MRYGWKAFDNFMEKKKNVSVKSDENAHIQFDNLPVKSKREILNSLDIPQTLQGKGKAVNNYENIIENLDDESKALFDKQVMQYTLLTRRAEKINKEANIQSINISVVIRRYIKSLESNSTKESYERGIAKFIAYANDRGKDLLHCEKQDAEDYRNYIKNFNESNSTKRIRIVSMKSFYNYLCDHYPFMTNIFNGIKTFRMVNLKEVHIPDSKTEINRIRKGILDCMINKSRFMRSTQLVAIIDIICKYGFRVGAFNRMEVNKNRTFNTITKCRPFKGTFDKATFNLICREFGSINSVKMPFIHLESKNLSSLFKYHTNRLYRENIIKYAYSLHDLRHWFAITFYRNTNDIVRTSKALGHANLQVTGVYFKQYFDIDIYNK